MLTLLSATSAASENISECRNLNVSGTTYLLNGSVNSSGTCMNIMAENITLDCQGNTINYSQSQAGYGVNNSDGFDNVLVKNCVIVQGGSFNYSYAIYFKNASQATIEYNNIETNDNVTTRGKNGINLENTTNSQIRDNIIKTQSGIETNLGISLYKSSYNNLTNNNITTTGYLGYGIYLHESTNNRVECNDIATTGQAAYGAVLYKNSTNNTVKGNNITTTGLQSIGVYIESSYNNLTEDRISTSNTGACGVHLYGDSDNNIITNSRIKSNQSIGIYLQHFGADVPENNILYNNLINGSSLPVNLSSSVGNNTWNTTEQDGTRIHGAGNRIGGNYYTNSTGGYSDSCSDSDKDGFCDLPYNLSTGNMDYLPLSNGYKPPSPPTTTLYTPPKRKQDSSGGYMPYTAKPVPSCFDGILNCHDGACEKEMDCGGPCKPCPSCSDGIQDNGEEGIDCGGSCPPCNTTGKVEEVIVVENKTEEKEEIKGSDSCSNGVLDGRELGVDCGGPCGPCKDGQFCVNNLGCISGWCHNQVCMTSSCSDGIKGPGETGIDCGGSCGKCPSLDVVDSCSVGEYVNINVLNPAQAMALLITDPDGKIKSYTLSNSAGSNAVMRFSPTMAGRYLIQINGYSEEAVLVVEEEKSEQSSLTIKMEWIIIALLFVSIAFIVHEERKNKAASEEWDRSEVLLKIDSGHVSRRHQHLPD
ncbi:MAG: right-handed parallel beta-helix repeat-containing protein [Candidatus Altiarchaeota archaeon]|nr:right-handed parallel beta-helix repeat-containing protein [Candidatus Altiarchaeota archaeon]